MGYVVRKFKTKRGLNAKILFESHVGGVRRAKYIPRADWPSLGFELVRPGDEVGILRLKERVKQLNKQAEFVRYEKRRLSIIDKVQQDHRFISGFYPEHLIIDFENRLKLRAGDSNPKEMIIWRRALWVLHEIKLSVGDWELSAPTFYQKFQEMGWSLSYVRGIIKMLNDWGKFYSRTTRELFVPLPYPRGRARVRIGDAEPSGMGNKASGPLTPALLESKKSQLSLVNYNWLYLAVWLGLRPIEIDNLMDSGKWRLDASAGTAVLWVYQSKLISVPKEKRWKPIPLFCPRCGGVP